MKLALHRSVWFWLWVLVLAVLLWAWADSRKMQTMVHRPGGLDVMIDATHPVPVVVFGDGVGLVDGAVTIFWSPVTLTDSELKVRHDPIAFDRGAKEGVGEWFAGPVVESKVGYDEKGARVVVNVVEVPMWGMVGAHLLLCGGVVVWRRRRWQRSGDAGSGGALSDGVAAGVVRAGVQGGGGSERTKRVLYRSVWFWLWALVLAALVWVWADSRKTQTHSFQAWVLFEPVEGRLRPYINYIDGVTLDDGMVILNWGDATIGDSGLVLRPETKRFTRGKSEYLGDGWSQGGTSRKDHVLPNGGRLMEYRVKVPMWGMAGCLVLLGGGVLMWRRRSWRRLNLQAIHS